MKKTVAVIITVLMLFTAAMPCLAASPAKFSVNIVSESDTEAVISIDYDGGSSFQNFDFDLKYNDKKLKPKEAYEGDGLTNFVIASKKSGGNSAISLINKDINPIKGTLASLIAVKTVNGKDMFIVSFQKLTKDKLTASDISLKFTTCQNNGANLQTDVVVFPSDTESTPAVTQDSTDKAQQTPNPDGSVSNAEGSTDSNGSTAQTASTENGVQPDGSEEEAGLDGSITQVQENTEKKDVKKMVWIPAAAICLVFVGVAAAVFVKKKKEDNTKEDKE